MERTSIRTIIHGIHKIIIALTKSLLIRQLLDEDRHKLVNDTFYDYFVKPFKIFVEHNLKIH